MLANVANRGYLIGESVTADIAPPSAGKIEKNRRVFPHIITISQLLSFFLSFRFN
jgi:hypothetical protein